MQIYKPDFDPHQTTLEAIRGIYSELYGQGRPVLRSDVHGGFYTLSSYSELRRAAGDGTRSPLPGHHAAPAAGETGPHRVRPEHTYWRNPMEEVMTVKAVRAVEDAVRRDTNIMIDAFASRGDAGLVGQLAAIVPGNTICNLIGVTDPARGELGCHLSFVTTESNFNPAEQEQEQEQAFGAFVGFCMEEIGARRARPQGDFLSRLAKEEVEGRRLTDQEVVGLVIGFFFAGHHTTTAGLASLFSAIATDPGVRRALIAEPGLIPKAAEEAIGWRLRCTVSIARRLRTSRYRVARSRRDQRCG